MKKANSLRCAERSADTRQRIAAILEKITSAENLNRIYRFIKYIYIHREG